MLFEMIDFIKFELIDPNIHRLEKSEYLDFYFFVNSKTGEIGKYKFANFRGLKFKIYETSIAFPLSRVTVEGSLHKYWNLGRHNYNDFGIEEINEVLKDLKSKFGIKPENCNLRQLEIGINLKPPNKTESILNSCIMHKTTPFKWVSVKDEGSYIQALFQRHIIKIYDKKKHYTKKGYTIKDEILRFEIKFLKMVELNEKKIYSLQHLLDYGLENCISWLVNAWNLILFYDAKELDTTKYKDRYSNQIYWKKLNYEKFKYHRKNLDKIVSKNPNNEKIQIAKIIKLKGEQITKNPLN